VKWTSPEALKYKEFTIKSDIWAYGVLLIELFTHGSDPYPGMSNVEVMELVKCGKRHRRPSECSEAMYNVMLTCWNSIPANRPTFEYLYNTMENFDVYTESGYQDAS
jgi:serine/threonine protein kinase